MRPCICKIELMEPLAVSDSRELRRISVVRRERTHVCVRISTMKERWSYVPSSEGQQRAKPSKLSRKRGGTDRRGVSQLGHRSLRTAASERVPVRFGTPIAHLNVQHGSEYLPGGWYDKG